MLVVAAIVSVVVVALSSVDGAGPDAPSTVKAHVVHLSDGGAVFLEVAGRTSDPSKVVEAVRDAALRTRITYVTVRLIPGAAVEQCVRHQRNITVRVFRIPRTSDDGHLLSALCAGRRRTPAHR